MSTQCGRYKIRKFIPEEAPHGRPDAVRYQCWAKGLYFGELGPWLKSFDEARSLCERHASGAA